VKVTPFLLFDGTCAEAMTFYEACFGGDLSLTRLGDTPMKDQAPAGQHHRIVYANLKSDTIDLSATDWLHPTRMPRQGNTVALYVSDAPYGELRAIFDKLATGADPGLLDDLRDMPFGSYGHLADRFGVHWFFRGDRQGGREGAADTRP
jgi:PhnB protein